jgi:type I restriction enzyme, S subunit
VSVRDAIPAPCELPSNWRFVTLREVTTKIGSGATPRGGESAYLPLRDKFALIRSQNVFDHRFEIGGLAFISDEQAADLANAQVRSGDVLLNITGDGVTFARACLVPDAILPACVNQHVSIVRSNPSFVDPGYLAAYLAHPSTKGYIESFNAGGSRRAITKGHIESFRLPLPPLTEQKQIGAILGAMDRKIDLNQGMNETLGAMTGAIFKSWFVDYDSARTKANRFEDSILGKVPCGWRVAELDNIAEVIDCLHSKKPARQPSGRPLIQLSNIRDDGLVDMTDTYFISEQDYELWISRMEAREGDCVITNVGRVAAVAQIPAGAKAALGRNMTGLRCRREYSYPTFLLQLLMSESMKEEIVLKIDSGTILESLNVRSIPRLRFVLPPTNVAEEFERMCRPFRAKMEANLGESRALTAIRDTLLPKLISGELRVKQVEEIVEAHV